MQVHASQHFNTCLYHGKGRDSISSPSSLAAHSVVITSYTMVANECGTIGTMQGNSELIDLASDDDEDTKGTPITSTACPALHHSTRTMCFTTEIVFAPNN